MEAELVETSETATSPNFETNRWAERSAQALALAVFRICYGAVLLAEVCHFHYFRRLILDDVPYLQRAPFYWDLLLYVWMAAIVCVILGWRMPVATAANYAMTVLFLGVKAHPLFEYHIDYAYLGVNFLLMIAPLADALSLDSRRKPGRGRHVSPDTNYGLYAYAFVFTGIALVYFDSFLFKYRSEMWRTGLGLWLPASLPQMAWFRIPQPLLDQRRLMIFLGYLTLVFETVFIFVMWRKRFHATLFLIGFGLHASIALVFPIPLFGLAYLAIYLLLIPPAFWQRVAGRGTYPPAHSADFSDPAIAGTTKPRRFRLRESLCIATMVLMGVLQVLCTSALHSVKFHRLPPESRMSGVVNPVLAKVAWAGDFVSRPARLFLGLTSHDVFLDSHFSGYDHLLAVRWTGQDDYDPIPEFAKVDGGPGRWVTGRVWAFCGFRLNGVDMPADTVESGLGRFVAFWAGKKGLASDGLDFEILYRKVETPWAWTPGHLERQLAVPWERAGEGTWQDQSFRMTLDGPLKRVEPNRLPGPADRPAMPEIPLPIAHTDR